MLLCSTAHHQDFTVPQFLQPGCAQAALTVTSHPGSARGASSGASHALCLLQKASRCLQTEKLPKISLERASLMALCYFPLFPVSTELGTPVQPGYWEEGGSDQCPGRMLMVLESCWLQHCWCQPASRPRLRGHGSFPPLGMRRHGQTGLECKCSPAQPCSLSQAIDSVSGWLSPGNRP